MSNDLQLRQELEQRSTDELVSILRNRDEDEWRPEVFAVVTSILKARGVSPEDVTRMGPEGVDVVESQETVTLEKFFSPAEGHAVQMALEAAGIPAWLADEEGGTIYGIGIGARLQVRAKDADAARALLASHPVASANLPADIAEPPCPACGSHNVSSEAWVQTEGEKGPWATRRRWYYVCSDCQEAWPA